MYLDVYATCIQIHIARMFLPFTIDTKDKTLMFKCILQLIHKYLLWGFESFFDLVILLQRLTQVSF